MSPERPDLSKLDPQVRFYIEHLESELERLRLSSSAPRRTTRPSAAMVEDDRLEDLPEINEPAEPPTTIQIITATAGGVAKRTFRHLYNLQRRGGMGVFDLETPENQPPAVLTMADEGQNLLVLTRQARAYRLPLNLVTEAPVHARGALATAKLSIPEDDPIVAILPEQAEGYLALVSRTGMVRTLRHHVFGEYMKPGLELYKFVNFGALAGACWTSGSGDLLIVSRQGRAIRFSEKLVPPTGGPGMRLTDGDEAVAITPVDDRAGVLLLSADGKGIIRLMDNFAANKAPGSGGKFIINTDRLVTALNTTEREHALIISRLGKIIRFRLQDVPEKDSVVQGVILMSLRSDEPVAAVLA
jgi:DNA gyrase subunit A